MLIGIFQLQVIFVKGAVRINNDLYVFNECK